MTKRGKGRPKLMRDEWEEAKLKASPKQMCYVCGREGKGYGYVGKIPCVDKDNVPVTIFKCKRKNCYSKVIEGVNMVHTPQGVYHYNSKLPVLERYKLLNVTELSALQVKTAKIQSLKPKKVKVQGIPKKGMISTLVELLSASEYTFDELVTQSGASPSTVKIQINYRLKQAGLKVVKVNRDGVDYYSIPKEVSC